MHAYIHQTLIEFASENLIHLKLAVMDGTLHTATLFQIIDSLRIFFQTGDCITSISYTRHIITAASKAVRLIVIRKRAVENTRGPQANFRVTQCTPMKKRRLSPRGATG